MENKDPQTRIQQNNDLKRIVGIIQFRSSFKCISVIFHHSPSTYCIPLDEDKGSLYEICSLAICIKIKAFHWVNGKQLSFLKTCLEYLVFYIAAY